MNRRVVEKKSWRDLLGLNSPTYRAPYPSNNLIQMQNKHRMVKYWHYRDCSGRMVRDCNLLHYARQLTSYLLDISRAMTGRGSLDRDWWTGEPRTHFGEVIYERTSK